MPGMLFPPKYWFIDINAFFRLANVQTINNYNDL